ncbi:hypothetical protein [Acinetobacter sp. ANC 3832]|uniref:hypothetical protein n=1 Tax=Acinetobacter sp. ANC 3832 TaxID=1977874 RepID=UPI000A330833|nr:hypothetical protein [Acinetobacter sp. ANC 3832]OTG95000.1 hypothetical protein B9T35_06470 [Acinetobacter sp. ANC 3832]
MTEEHINSYRHAVIKPNNNQHVLDALKENLPEGYELLIEKPTINIGVEKYIHIKTPTDDIQLYVSDDGKYAETLHVFGQDKLSVQPSLPNDELAKLAVKLNATENVDMQVVASRNDLEGK